MFISLNRLFCLRRNHKAFVHLRNISIALRTIIQWLYQRLALHYMASSIMTCSVWCLDFMTQSKVAMPTRIWFFPPRLALAQYGTK